MIKTLQLQKQFYDRESLIAHVKSLPPWAVGKLVQMYLSSYLLHSRNVKWQARADA